MPADPEPATIVTLDPVSPSDWVRVGGADAADMLAEVRTRAADARPVIVSPDDAAEDMDDWIAIVSAAVVEGAVGVETSHTRQARRILTVHKAITTGSAEPAP